MATHGDDGSIEQNPEYLTRADIPLLVKSVAEAMMTQLQKKPDSDGAGTSRTTLGESLG